MPGVSANQIREDIAKIDQPETDRNGDTVRRRAVKVDLDSFTTDERNTADRDGQIVLTRQRVRTISTEKPTRG